MGRKLTSQSCFWALASANHEISLSFSLTGSFFHQHLTPQFTTPLISSDLQVIRQLHYQEREDQVSKWVRPFKFLASTRSKTPLNPTDNITRFTAGIDGEVSVKKENRRLYISGKFIDQSKNLFSKTVRSDFQLQCATETSKFPSLNSVKLIIFGSETEEGKYLSLEKDSPEIWKHALPIEL